MEKCIRQDCVDGLLKDAYKIVNGDRRQEYGDARKCFSTIAKLWSDYTDCKITAYDVANMMILLKVVRARGKGFQKSSYEDIAGYAYCAEIVYNGEQLAKKNSPHEMAISE